MLRVAIETPELQLMASQVPTQSIMPPAITLNSRDANTKRYLDHLLSAGQEPCIVEFTAAPTMFKLNTKRGIYLEALGWPAGQLLST